MDTSWRDGNSLARQMQDAKRYAGYAIEREIPAFVLSGMPGIGKDHAVEAAIAEANAQVVRIQPTDRLALLNAFKEAKDTKLIFSNEGDALFNRKEQVDILKLAMDVTGPRIYSHEIVERKGGSRGVRVKEVVSLRAPVLITCNVDPEKGGFRVNDVDIAALMERLSDCFFHIQADRETTLKYTVGLAVYEESLRFQAATAADGRRVRRPVSLDVQNEALRWFYVHADQLKTVTPRTLRNVRDIIIREAEPELRQRDLARLVDVKRPPRSPERAPVITPPRKEAA